MLRVDWAIACRYAEVNNNLATIVGGGIDHTYIPALGAQRLTVRRAWALERRHPFDVFFDREAASERRLDIVVEVLGDVDVAHRGADVGVPEQALQASEVFVAVVVAGRERVAQHVRVAFLARELGVLAESFDDLSDRVVGERTSQR